jgi:hypothetical protein
MTLTHILFWFAIAAAVGWLQGRYLHRRRH